MCFRVSTCDFLVSLRGVLQRAAKRLTEALQVPFHSVFRVKFTAEFFSPDGKKKKNHLVHVSQPSVCTSTCTGSQDPPEVAVSSVCHHGCPPPLRLFLSASLSPRVPPLPWMLGQILVSSAVQPLEDASVTQPALAGHRLLFSPQRARVRTQDPFQASFGY